MALRGLLLAAVASFTLGTGVANATVFAGTATFADLTNGNVLNVAGIPNPASFTSGNLAAGGSTYVTGFIALLSTDTSIGSETDQLSLTFNFTDPTSASFIQSGQASETVLLQGSLDNGVITWNGDTNTDQNGTFARTVVTFSDGAVADIDVYDSLLAGTSSARAAQIDLQITDVKDVPEPASMAILGAGLFGLGMIRRRRAAAI